VVQAVSTALAIVYGVALFAVLLIIPGTVTWLKGQRALLAAGLLAGGLVWWITAMRLARPDSWWADRFYDEAKLARSTQRYTAA
jgi:Na+/proline symporter